VTPKSSPDPRRYPDRPWVGVGVVVWRDDKVLLVRRGKAPRQGEWGIPGGAQDLGETLFETATREVREETGLTIRPTAIVTAIDAILRDSSTAVEFHYTLIEVSAEWVSGKAVAQSDIEAVRWVLPAEVPGVVAWDETIRVIAEAVRLRGV
jgi:8-oxo-dGTP diphosphatase